MSASPTIGLLLHLSPEEEAAYLALDEPCTARPLERFAALLQRREREMRALQAAFVERAAVHELLTAHGVPPGELRERVRWVLELLGETR